ncbi:MAG: hypothetical protein ACYC1Y_03640 [Minisyncoccota bacterium]
MNVKKLLLTHKCHFLFYEHKNLIIGAGVLTAILVLFSGFFWYTNTSTTSSGQEWVTYTQRLDSGDVISIDYPTRLEPTYRASVAGGQYVDTSTGTHVNDMRFNPRNNAESVAFFEIVQDLPISSTVIQARKNYFENETALSRGINIEPSRWHLGEWTTYESKDPSNMEYQFVLNGRSLLISFADLPENEVERIMLSIRWNDIQMSKLDSMQGWDWPSIKTGK